VILADGSEAVGCALRDVKLPKGSLIVGVVRGGEALVPKGGTVLEEREHVLLISGRRQISDAVGALATNTAPVKEVTVSGGGRIGLGLALALERAGISVRVIERGEGRAPTLLPS
jgi:trk system potassium uptake protein